MAILQSTAQHSTVPQTAPCYEDALQRSQIFPERHACDYLPANKLQGVYSQILHMQPACKLGLV